MAIAIDLWNMLKCYLGISIYQPKRHTNLLKCVQYGMSQLSSNWNGYPNTKGHIYSANVSTLKGNLVSIFVNVQENIPDDYRIKAHVCKWQVQCIVNVKSTICHIKKMCQNVDIF